MLRNIVHPPSLSHTHTHTHKSAFVTKCFIIQNIFCLSSDIIYRLCLNSAIDEIIQYTDDIWRLEFLTSGVFADRFGAPGFVMILSSFLPFSWVCIINALLIISVIYYAGCAYWIKLRFRLDIKTKNPVFRYNHSSGFVEVVFRSRKLSFTVLGWPVSQRVIHLPDGNLKASVWTRKLENQKHKKKTVRLMRIY